MSMYENVGMTSLDYLEEILQLRKALADVSDECSKAYDKIANFENPWISVKNEMPPEMETVLCLQADGDYTVGYLYDTEENGWNTQVYGTVTHWMPLPTPPEREDDTDGKDDRGS